MVDGVLYAPGRPPPADWRHARLRTPAGTVRLRRDPYCIRVVVRNFDYPLLAAQRTVAAAL
jgi:hypothetical protein